MHERFWSKVSKEPGQGPRGDCWEWQGAKHNQGYGIFTIKKKHFKAHRISKQMELNQELGRKELVCHTCDNPACVRPSHLYVGTHADNARDMVMRGRKPIKRGAAHPMVKLTEASVYAIRDLCAEGASKKAVAKQFGVCVRTIYYVVERESWPHLPKR